MGKYSVNNVFGYLFKSERAISVQYRLDKQPVILGGDTDMPLTAGQKVLDTLPLVIAKGIAAHSVNSESS